MKFKTAVLLTIWSCSLGAQTQYKSATYNYHFEIPKGFTQQEIIGRNVDLKVVDSQGAQVIIVAKLLDKSLDGDVALQQLLELPVSSMEKQLSEGLNNVKLLKRDKTFLNGKKAMYYHYKYTKPNANTYTYSMTYHVVDKGILYTITTYCTEAELPSYTAIFFRAIQSFKI